MSSPRPPDPSRRRFLGLLGLAAVGTALGSGSYARYGAIRRFVTERIEVPISGLPKALDGLRIAHLSDLHIDPYTGAAYLERVARAANALAPDLVLLTGDFVTDRAAAIAELAPILAQLRARHGVYASLGNHDIWTDAGHIARSLDAVGVPVLINEGITLEVNGAPLHLAGVDSGWGGNPDLARALATAPTDARAIALVHEPDLIDGPTRDPRVVLQLSGHSHGGQIRVPGVGAPVLPYLGRRYDLGLYRVADTWLYTNRGIGVGGVPVRFNCPPELALLTLIRS